MKFYSLILVLSMIVNSLHSQTNKHYTISGYVSEVISGELLIGVNIYLTDHKIGTVTNTYGFYSLTLPAADTVGLIISYVGFHPEKIKVSQMYREG